MTHTFATLEVSAEAYDEIAGKLREAGYDHAFVTGAIDMHGIGITRGKEAAPTTGWICRECGCTDANGCPGGCSWIEPNLCSECA